MNLSDRDQQILKFLRQHQADVNSAPAPSYREIAAACKLSSTALVKKSLEQLKDAGLIEWFPGVARSIRLVTPTASDIEQSAVISRRQQSRGWA